MVYQWLEHWLLRLIPGRCLLCGAPGRGAIDLCRGCAADLPALAGACRCCALPLTTPGVLCGSCLRRPPPFHRCIAPFRYDGAMLWLIGQLKSGPDFAAARLLATTLAATVRQSYRDEPLPDALVAMPLHWRRLQRRGYNQAALLTHRLGRELGIATLDDCVRRRRPTASQQTLPRGHRQRNVRGAFAASAAAAGRHVAIVDDVVTTGATAAAVAAALLGQDAARVDVWCVARTPKPGG